MGTFFHPITVIGPNGSSETLDALVDAEHLFALLPYRLLVDLDFWPDRSHRYKGTERGFGQVEADLRGERARITYVVGSDNEPAIIGRHTLDSFALDVDEDQQRLVRRVFKEIRHLI